MNVKGFEFSDIIINYINDNTWQRYGKNLLRSLKSFSAVILKNEKNIF